MQTTYYVDPSRLNLDGSTGIRVRAINEGYAGRYDIATLDDASHKLWQQRLLENPNTEEPNYALIES